MAGLTLLGGEPFEPANQPAVAELLRQLRARCPGKNVWAFTGFLKKAMQFSCVSLRRLP